MFVIYERGAAHDGSYLSTCRHLWYSHTRYRLRRHYSLPGGTVMAQQKPPGQGRALSATVITVESIGSHKVLLLANGHVQFMTDTPTIRTDLSPTDATKLYDL